MKYLSSDLNDMIVFLQWLRESLAYQTSQVVEGTTPGSDLDAFHDRFSQAADDDTDLKKHTDLFTRRWRDEECSQGVRVRGGGGGGGGYEYECLEWNVCYNNLQIN